MAITPGDLYYTAGETTPENKWVKITHVSPRRVWFKMKEKNGSWQEDEYQMYKADFKDFLNKIEFKLSKSHVAKKWL